MARTTADRNRRSLLMGLLAGLCGVSGAFAQVAGPLPARAPTEARNAQEWRRSMRAALQRRKRYPAALRRASHAGGQAAPSGKAMLSFSVARDGEILSAAITESSGHAELDAAALAMAKPGTHLPRVPADMPGATHRLMVPVIFDGGPAPSPQPLN